MRIFIFAALLQLFCIGVSSAAELEVDFEPERPVIHFGSPTQVGGITVYDHSEFSTKLTNRYSRPIEIQAVKFISIGDNERSGLGDIINYWPWKGSHALMPGEYIYFNKVWGFTVDTPNTTMKYRYEISYRIGDDADVKTLVTELVLEPES